MIEKEKDVQKQIMDWLKVQHAFFYRNNSGAMVSEYQGKKRFMRFGAVGSPDIVLVFKGIYVGVECKATKGRQSEYQITFQQQLEAAGGKYIVVHSLDEFINEYLKL